MGTYAIVYYVSSNVLARKKQEQEQEMEKVEEDQAVPCGQPLEQFSHPGIVRP